MKLNRLDPKRVWILLAVCAISLGLWIIVNMKTTTGPTWRSLIVGKSNVAQIISELGVPSRTEHTSPNVDIYYYKENAVFDWAAHKIVVRDGVVERIEEDMFVYHPVVVKLTSFVDKYGVPDLVTWSRNGPEERVAIFLQQGILIRATALPLKESQVIRAFYVIPHSLAEMEQEFSDVFSLINPFPDSDVVSPENPWELELKKYHSN